MKSLELRSLVRAGGTLELSLVETVAPAPGADDVLVRVEAAPINPSDLGLLVGAADLSKSEAERLNEALERGLTAYTYLSDEPLE